VNSPLWAIGAALAGVFVGFLLSELKDRRNRARRCRAHWRAIEGDLELSRSNAATYLAAHIDAPAYRLPAYAFASAVVEVMKDGDVGEDDYRPLLEYFLAG
jgi:hypothetical protein